MDLIQRPKAVGKAKILPSNLNSAYLVGIIVLSLVYYLSARIGLSLGAVSGFATLVWPPAGVALASLVIWGYKLWPGIFLGAFVANLLVGAPPLVSLGIATGNTLEALLGARLLSQANFNPAFVRLKDSMVLIFEAAIVSTLVAAAMGTTSLFLGGVIQAQAYRLTFLAWWVGDGLGVLVVASLILVWSVKGKVWPKGNDALELVGVYLLLILLSLITFGPSDVNAYPISYLSLPPLFWLAVRFGALEAITGLFAFSIIAVIGTSQGYGQFAVSMLSQNLFFLQGFVGVQALIILALSSLTQENRDLSKKKDVFVNIASHELKTPITVIKGYTQFLNSLKYKDKKVALYLRSVNREVDSLVQLIGELLDFSRTGSDKLSLEYQHFSLDQLIKETISDLRQINLQNRVVFKRHPRVLVNADRYRINQVLVNFLTNAIKFSPIQKEVAVKLARKKGEAVVSVEDKGIGISERDQNEIFNKFFQAGRGDKSGLGLGLYISSEIIKSHKGRIWVESKEGKGSVFYFSLPLTKSR